MSEIKELTFKNIDQVDEKTLTLAKILVEKKLIRIDGMRGINLASFFLFLLYAKIVNTINAQI